jgi:hypothetical protein
LLQIIQSIRKAQEYYIKDLCLNTKRFDSWAGLTVIEFYKIEEFITVCIEKKFFKEVVRTSNTVT